VSECRGQAVWPSHLPGDEPQSLANARSAILNVAFDQINTLVVVDEGSEPGWMRQWALDSLTASIWAPLIVAPGEAPPPANENNLGWAARVPMDPSLSTGWFSADYGTVIGINLARSTRCPEDHATVVRRRFSTGCYWLLRSLAIRRRTSM
jgi:hypothetical protein